MKLLVLLLAFFCTAIGLVAQKGELLAIHALSIGDTVPQIAFNNVINHSAKTARLRDFKEKYVIIDFWSTWCTPCIELFPELDSIQRNYKTDLIIIAVTHQSKELIERFIKKNKYAKNVSFIFVADGDALIKMFPHGSVPHEVWIGKDRKIVAVTSSAYLTHKNVETFVSGNKFSFIPKNDNLVFNYEKDIEDNKIQAYDTLLLNKTTFHKYLPGLNTIRSFNKTDSGYLLSLINEPILQLYKFALSNTLKNFDRQQILELDNIGRYIFKDKNYDEWMLENAYCYEASGKYLTSNKAIKEKIIIDLNTNLGLDGRVEKRKVVVYSLINTGKGERTLITQGGSPDISWKDNQIKKQLHNQNISVFIDFLNGASSERKDVFSFSDKTNIYYNIDIELDFNDPGNIDLLEQQLNRYGLGLIKGNTKADVFVLSERPGK